MTGYTRQSVADIINGSNITAPPLNAEFNQLAAAFEGADGHAHDGTAGNGPKINLQTSVDGYLMPVNGGTGGRNNTTATTNPTATSDALAGYAPGSIWINSTTGRIFVCAVNTNSAAVWLEVVGVRNGNSITPIATNTVDIGSNAVRYKDLYLAGTALVGSLSSGPATVDSLSVTGATTATGLVTANGGFLNNGVFTTTGTANLNGNVNIGDGTADVVTFGGRIAGNLVPGTDDASDLGTSTLEWRNIWVDGTANIDNLVADAVTVSGGTIDGTVIGGTTAQTVRGTTITALTGFVGNLTGNVTGNTAGTHTGPVTGDVTGNVTGNVTAATGTSSFNNVTINGSLDLNSGTVGTITGLSAPVNATDAATKQYVDTADALKVNKSGDTVTGNLTLSGGAKVTGLPTPTLSSDAASKSYVDTAIANLINTAPGTLDTLNEIATALGNDPNFAATMTTELAKKLDKTGGSMTGAIDMGTNKITSLAAPTANGDATNKSYVDTAVATKVSKAGDTMSGALAMGGNKVTGLGTPTADTDASTKAYVDTAAATKLNLSGGTMTGAIAMGSNKITGLGAPTVGTDATTKDYVDGILGSATSAATSAASAATSATSAATSASNAATSASQAAASYDSFDDRYLGAKSANPTVDNDGNALLVGALYWNTVSNEMRVWSGAAWLASYIPVSGYAQLSGATFTGTVTVPNELGYDYTTSVLPDIAPALNLNFVQSGVVDPRITFTRSSTATFVGSNGLIQTAAFNAPRLDYDPVTRAPKGLLIEEQRTNLLVRSEEFDNAAWTKIDSTVTANSTTSPDGTVDADKLVETAASGVHYVASTGSSVSVTSGTAYTFSVYLKAAERSWAVVEMNGTPFACLAYFDLVNGVVGSTNGSPSATSITHVGNGWYRCTITKTATASATSLLLTYIATANNSPVYAGTAGSGIYVWGAQAEAGSFATSYIPTVASQVTRTADVATMTGTNFSQWFGGAIGSFVTEWDSYAAPAPPTNRVPVSLVGTTGFVYVNTAATFNAHDGVNYATAGGSAAAVGPHKGAWSFGSSGMSICLNGGTIGTGTYNNSFGAATAANIANLNGNSLFLNGHIRSIQYYNTRLANTVLQGITA